MTIISRKIYKSSNYELNLTGIVPVNGFFTTTLTGVQFISGGKPEAPKIKITDKNYKTITWAKSKTPAAKQLSLKGSVENQVNQAPLRLIGTKAQPTKNPPALTIVAPLNTSTAVVATEQNAEPTGTGSIDSDDADPDHNAALARLVALLEYEVALNLEEELEEEEAEQEEEMDWDDDSEVENEFFEAQGLDATSTTFTRLEFLHHVLPPTGMFYFGLSTQKGKAITIFPNSIEELDTWAEAQPALGNDAFFSLATLANERMLARCVEEYKSVWIALDVGKSTAFPTQADAMVALKAFVDKLGLPTPTIVSSGGEIHVYFTFTNAVGYDQWHQIATALKARIRAENLQVNEAGLPTNSIRTLRLPDTVNFDNRTEVDVKVIVCGIHATVEDYNRILNIFVETETKEEIDCDEDQVDWAEEIVDCGDDTQPLERVAAVETETINSKPETSAPIFDNTPHYLQDKKHWLLWEYRFKGGRWTKVPLQCTKSLAKTNDPTTWASFEAVKTAYLSGGFDGIGIAFADDGATGIDIDKCFTIVNGEKVWDETKKQYVEEILNTFKGKAYVELSPSKTGFHIICNGKALRSGKAQRVINGASAQWIELYAHPSSRYFTFTGHVVADLTGTPIDCQADLEWLDKTFMTIPKEVKNAGASNNDLDAAYPTEDLLSVIGNPTNATSYLFNYGLSVKKLNSLTNQYKVERCLWLTTNLTTGKELKVNDEFRFTDTLSINKGKLVGDHSSVDLYLCSKLAFFTNRNAHQMDVLFRQSCLMRQKWVELRGSDTYGNITIQKAIREAVENNAEVYKSGKPKIELAASALISNKQVGLTDVAPDDIPDINLGGFVFSGFSSSDSEDGEAFVADKKYKVFTTDVRDGTEKTRPLTELGNALRLKDKYADDVKFVIGHSLIHWVEGCWKWDLDSSMTRRLAAKLHMDIYAESLTHPQFIQQFATWSRASQTEAKIENAVSLYSDFAEVRIPFNFIDGDIFKVGLANSTQVIDLKTGLVRRAERSDYITKSLNVNEVGSAASAERWLRFLNEVFNNDQELIAWFKMWCGYLLTGSTKEQFFVFLYGFGSNGKGVLTTIINTILGDYSKTVGSETFTDTKRQAGAASPDIAKLPGARLVLSTETNEGVALSEALVKTITGEDMLSARHLRKDEFEFKPQFKMMMSGNHKPVIRGTDNGIWRRVRLLPFTKIFDESEKDVNLTPTLLREAPHILAWMIDGCLEWQKIGLSKTPKVILNATAEYRADQDILGLWIEEECEIGAQHSQANSTLYYNYKVWCEKNSNKPASNKTFSQRLSERGFDKRKSDGTMHWSGIRITPLFQDS